MSLRDFGWTEFLFLVGAVRWTALLALTAFVGGGLLGLVVAALRVAPAPVLRRLAAGYVALFQGTPVLVQLLLAYYGSALLGASPDAWLAAGLAFVLNSAAFFGEIWRGCVEAVPRGQWEAARALGLRWLAALRLVVMPQALRLMAAPTAGYAVQVVKGTSVASLIGITEVTRTAVMVNTVTFEPFQVFGTVCLVYFAACWPLSLLAGWLDRRLDRRRQGGVAQLLRRHGQR